MAGSSLFRRARGEKYKEGAATKILGGRPVGRPSPCLKCDTVNGHKRIHCSNCGTALRASAR